MTIGPFWCVNKDAWLQFKKDDQGKFYAEMAYRNPQDSTKTKAWKKELTIDFWTIIEKNTDYPNGEGIRLLGGVVYRTGYKQRLDGWTNVYYYDSNGDSILLRAPKGTNPDTLIKPFNDYPLNWDKQGLEQSTKHNSIPSLPEDCPCPSSKKPEENVSEKKEESIPSNADEVRPADQVYVEQLITENSQQGDFYLTQEQLEEAIAVQQSMDMAADQKAIKKSFGSATQTPESHYNFNLRCYIALAASATIVVIGIIIAYAPVNSEVSTLVGSILAITGGVTSTLTLCGLFKPRIDRCLNLMLTPSAQELKS